jgi:hypothetical protein
MLRTLLRLRQNFNMSGAIFLLPVYAFMEFTRAVYPFLKKTAMLDAVFINSVGNI